MRASFSWSTYSRISRQLEQARASLERENPSDAVKILIEAVQDLLESIGYDDD